LPNMQLIPRSETMALNNFAHLSQLLYATVLIIFSENRSLDDSIISDTIS
jgi:hypothetical protein